MLRCTPLLLALACATPAKADPAPERWSPLHVAKLRNVGSVHLSPDGKRVAYTLHVPRAPFADDDGPAQGELHLVAPGTPSRPLMVGGPSFGALAWRPDGAGLGFIAKRGEDKEPGVYFLPIDGGEALLIAAHETAISAYAWHPKSDRIAFIAPPKPDKDRKELEKKGFNQEVVEEQFKNAEVWIVPLRSYAYDATQKKEPQAKKLTLDGHASGLAFSPDGKHLAVVLAPTPSVDDSYMKRRVHVVEVESGKPIAALPTTGKLGAWCWSPDGTRIAAIAGEDQHDPSEGRLFVGDLGGTGQILYADFEGHFDDLAWKKKDEIVALASVGTATKLLALAPDGQGVRELVAGGDAVFTMLSTSEDGTQAALVAHSPSHTFEVYASKLAPGSTAARLSDSNPWMSKLPLAKQELVRYKARDGLEIEGVLVHPLEKPAGPAPLIVTVHGGPEAHVSNGWLTWYSQPGQVGAAEGFFSFYPNYRGSTGRGVKFSKLGQGDYAGAEFDDILDGVDHLVKQGLVDPKKVGVTGGSYGGFASAWMATKHTARFAAAVMFVGISNQISKYGTTDIPNEMFLVHSRKWPWENWDYFRERSPLTYVEQARTPILILHGKQDPRVHPAQSMELFRYLKTIGKVPVRLVLYEGEGHGNRKAAARYDYNIRLMQWMKHYLVGPGGAPPPEALEYRELKPAKEEAKQ